MLTTEKNINLTMLCDFYELTMANGYFENDMKDRITYFDVFFRSIPDGGGFAIAAGLEQAVKYIQELHFDDDDIAYLRGRGIFSEKFLAYLKNFHFSGDIWAVPEGTPIFPKEPMMTVRAPAIEAQLVETYLLLTLNHQSLIATKANRIVRAAQGRTVLEFGSRRAQGGDGAVLGARAAFIGGCAGSTGGGLKLSRVMLLVKAAGRDIGKMIHPRSVRRVRMDGKCVDKATLDAVEAFFFLYLFIIIICTLVISFDGYDFATNFTAALSCMSNIGPGLSLIGPSGSFAIFSDCSKIVMSFVMLLGRLEIYPLIILLTPSVWNRNTAA